MGHCDSLSQTPLSQVSPYLIQRAVQASKNQVCFIAGSKQITSTSKLCNQMPFRALGLDSNPVCASSVIAVSVNGVKSQMPSYELYAGGSKMLIKIPGINLGPNNVSNARICLTFGVDAKCKTISALLSSPQQYTIINGGKKNEKCDCCPVGECLAV